MKTINKTTQIGLLVAALIGGAIAAAATRAEPKSSPSRAAPEAIAESLSAAQNLDSAPEAVPVQGKVLEVIQVPNYTYLRLQAAGGQTTWAAVNSSPGVKVGDSVHVAQAQLMQSFHSASLNRDFEAIYFGVLGEPAAQANPHTKGAQPNPHVGVDMSAGSPDAPNPHLAGNPGTSASGALNPHAQVDVAGIEVGRIARAEGELGHSISELYGKKPALAGKLVRVRGVVVKSTPDVMGKTFVHLRDGSGSEASRDVDLTVTTQEKPQMRQTLVFEGTLELDVDLGAGYKYPLLLQNARVVSE